MFRHVVSKCSEKPFPAGCKRMEWWLESPLASTATWSISFLVREAWEFWLHLRRLRCLWESLVSPGPHFYRVLARESRHPRQMAEAGLLQGIRGLESASCVV